MCYFNNPRTSSEKKVTFSHVIYEKFYIEDIILNSP